MSLALPSIGQLSMNQAPILLQPPMSGINFTHGHISIPTTRATHMLTSSSLLSHDVPSSSNVVSSATTPSPMSSGLVFLPSSQASNPITVTQFAQPIPPTIQIGTSSIPLTRGKL